LFVRLIEQEPPDAIAEGKGAVRPREQRLDSAVRGPPARSNSEAKSNQKSRHATEAEAAWAPSD
jgi:hypothetical protein